MTQLASPTSASEGDIQRWQAVQHELWYGIPRKLEWNKVIQEVILCLRDLISKKCDINKDNQAASHWAILELAWKTTDIGYLIDALWKLGITRENESIFDQYCAHLEKKPQWMNIEWAKSVPPSDPQTARTRSSVVYRVCRALLAMFVPHTRK